MNNPILPASAIHQLASRLTDDDINEIFTDPRVKPEGEDPYTSEDYERFVESMVPHCHCDPRFRPCDGVLAGGCCDRQLEPDPDDDRYIDYEP